MQPSFVRIGYVDAPSGDARTLSNASLPNTKIKIWRFAKQYYVNLSPTLITQIGKIHGLAPSQLSPSS